MEIEMTSTLAVDIRHVFGVERKLSLSAKAFLVLLRVSDSQALTCSQPLLSRWLSMRVVDLRRTLQELKKHGLIQVTENRNRWGSKSASTYHLSRDIEKPRICEAEG